MAHAQYGCTDPQAINYDAAASVNDGSCIYNTTNYTLVVKDTLLNVLSEISGMVYWNGKLYVHNDSGNPPFLFETDTANGTITKEIYLEGITNTDWEDITQDDTHFYIADVGNNAGDRTNLKIYKFPKAAIGPAYYDTVYSNEIEAILFTYPDQVNFANNLYNTPFDCEAVAYRNNSLHLFSKNWTLGACVHYTLPISAGSYVAVRMDSLNTSGTLITGADFASNSQLMMLGYKNTGTAEASLWYIYDFGNTDSFFVKGNKRKIGVGDALLVGQIEGICFADSSRGFASNERFNPIAAVDVLQKLYSFNTTAWYPYNINTHTGSVMNDNLEFSAQAMDHRIEIEVILPENDLIVITLYSNKGKKIRQKSYQLPMGRQYIQLDNLELSEGIYHVVFQNSKGVKKLSKIFFQNR